MSSDSWLGDRQKPVSHGRIHKIHWRRFKTLSKSCALRMLRTTHDLSNRAYQEFNQSNNVTDGYEVAGRVQKLSAFPESTPHTLQEAVACRLHCFVTFRGTIRSVLVRTTPPGPRSLLQDRPPLIGVRVSRRPGVAPRLRGIWLQVRVQNVLHRWIDWASEMHDCSLPHLLHFRCNHGPVRRRQFGVCTEPASPCAFHFMGSGCQASRKCVFKAS